MQSSKVDLVGVGLNATDTLIRLPHYPALGSKVEFRSADVLPGGQVATAVAACQQWGLRTRYVGKIGDDSAAAIHRAEFERLGVETHLLTAPGCASQQAVILVDDAGERTVLWKRDNRLTLLPEELQREWITDARALHLDGHDTAAAVTAAGWARDAGIPVIADLDDLYPGVEDAVRKNRLPDYQPRHSGTPDGRTGLAQIAAHSSQPLWLPPHRRNAGPRRASWPGTAPSSTTHPPFECSLWTPPAPATSSTPDLSMDFCKAGRCPVNLISPVLLPL